MTKAFENRVLNENIVDTRNYRYIAVEAYDEEGYYRIIKRIDIECVGWTSYLDEENWETVKTIR